MAYNAKNLSVLAYANGFTLWHYTTTDTAADVDTDGTPASGIFLINANAAGVVDAADMTAVGGSDLD